jgi:O-antigen biosynthesis protein WbqV
MGEPVSILRLAETMIRLKGKVPGTDIQIVTTGLRAGEKLHERLTYDHEEIDKTVVEGVLQVMAGSHQGELFRKQLIQMLDAAHRHDAGEALRLLGVLVPEFGDERAADLSRRMA